MRNRMLAELKNELTEMEFEEIYPVIENYMDISIEIDKCDAEDYSNTGNSRIAGDPDLPEHFIWPVLEDRFFTFIAQINCTELPEGAPDIFPKTGIMYFFLGPDDSAYDIANYVFYFNGDLSGVKRTAPPEFKKSISKERNFNSKKISFKLNLSFHIEDELYDKFDAMEIESYEVEDIFEMASGLWAPRESWSDDPRQSAYLCKNGFKELCFNTHRSPDEISHDYKKSNTGMNYDESRVFHEKIKEFFDNREYHEAQMKKWHILLKLSSMKEANMCWWDAGYLQFLINEDDFKNLDFSKTYACIATS